MNPAPVPLPALDDARSRRDVGLLEVRRGDQLVPLPLAAVRLSARVADRIAAVTVVETFRNPFPEVLEAVYIFPLSGGCAVSAFEMKVKDRTVKGVVRERGEARAAYRQAIGAGKRAGLLEQERDDVFTVTVGNLPPGEEVTVTIRYAERLPYFDDGATELRLPTVVAPRYVPGTPRDGEPAGDGVESDTDLVPDASRITPPRLADGFDPKVALAIEVELLRAPGDGDLADLACSQHAVRTSLATGAVTVRLAQDGEPLDRDFVLRWRLAGREIRGSCLAFRDGNDIFALLSLVPPQRDGFLGLARDVVFVLDRSGSMGGVKMASAARACSLLLRTLGPRDRFAIVAFDDRQEWMGEPEARTGEQCPPRRFRAADEDGLRAGEAFLRTIEARGGTELDGAVGGAIAALAGRHATAGRAPVVVVLTDGEVGDESRVLRRIQESLGDARVFTVGIDTAVNDGFLRRLAALGGGTASFVVPGEGLEEALCAVGREIGTPVVTDLKVHGSLPADERAPDRMPDLFAGRAAAAFLRLHDTRPVRVTGRTADGRAFDEYVPVREVAVPAVATLWARARVADLEDRFRLEPALQSDVRAEIVRLAVRHSLLTRFTAFVVVDEAEIANPSGDVRQVVQPVAMPAKWEAAEEMLCSANLSPAPAPMLPASLAMPGQADAAYDGGTQACFAAPPPPPPPPVACPKPVGATRAERAEPPRVAESERKALLQALDALARSYAAARAETDAGRVPPAEPLVRACAALKAALAKSVLAADLPGLQRFLRQSAPELLAALAVPRVAAAALAELFARHAAVLEAAVAEARGVLEGKGGSGMNFWEQSV